METHVHCLGTVWLNVVGYHSMCCAVVGLHYIGQAYNYGQKVLVERLVDGLSQAQSLRLEAELIAAFGTLDTDGMLTNSVMPSALGRKARAGLVVPSGAKEKAQVGLDLLKDAVLDLAKANPEGITNGETASVLGLKSDYGGGVKDYLSYSILGLLMSEGKVERDAEKGRGKHVARVR